MTLISFRSELVGDSMKWTFTVAYEWKLKKIILKEKPDWPMIHGANIEAVERWLLGRYGSLCYLAFGIFN